ncbi:unnamed protein product [marine sediment metagenome]|jgi:uncharacterized protein (UPF0332 family)|uniref:HEPN domain-containing protein n=1 Tax=marine sediment metagenome TaxID=412755 RepID=X1R3L2_9ZZZZ
MTHFFQPRIFLDIARKLKNYRDLDDEGKLRVVIGRAYYAAFLTAREYLKRYRWIEFREKGQHKKVLDALDDLNQEFIKNQLDLLRKSRVTADYNLNISIDENLCKKSIIISKDIIDSIEEI